MKCSSCYADNAAWASVCVMCGRAVLPIEFCPNGHILPPGERDCPVCPAQAWPEAPAWSGPARLRGVLVFEGAFLDVPGAGPRTWIELRDGAVALGLAESAPGQLRLVDPASAEGTARLLMRPDGLLVCRRTASTGKLNWQPLPPGEVLSLGGPRVRFLAFQVPPGLPGD